MEKVELIMAEWGFIFGVLLFVMQELIANSKLKSNSFTQLVINILKFFVKKDDKKIE